MKRDLGASWLPRVGWEGFGKVQNGSEECGGLMVPKSGVGRMGLGASWFRRVGWEGVEKAKNEA